MYCTLRLFGSEVDYFFIFPLSKEYPTKQEVRERKEWVHKNILKYVRFFHEYFTKRKQVKIDIYFPRIQRTGKSAAPMNFSRKVIG